MEELLDYRRRMMARFAQVADDIRGAVESLPRDARPEDIHRTLAHLRDVEAQVFYPCLERILAEQEPRLNCYDERDWEEKEYRREEPLEAILDEYIQLRARELQKLTSMAPSGWNRQGRHPVWGQRTLQWWAEKSLAHAEEHLKQIQ